MIKCPNCWRDMTKYYARRFGMCKVCLEGEEHEEKSDNS